MAERICPICKEEIKVYGVISEDICEGCYDERRSHFADYDEIIEVTIRKGKKNGKLTILEMVLPEKFDTHEISGMLTGAANQINRNTSLGFDWKTKIK